MSLDVRDLLDAEKYFLLEAASGRFQAAPVSEVSVDKPVSLELFLGREGDGIYSKPGDAGATEHVTALWQIYEDSDNLRGLDVVGVLRLGNKRAGVAGLGLRDSYGNSAVVFGGDDKSSLTCYLGALGIISGWRKEALKFYDDTMTTLSGTRYVLGYGQGGCLAAFVFLQRQRPEVNGFIVNSGLHFWAVLPRALKDCLRSTSFEHVVQGEARVRPHVSRVLPERQRTPRGGIMGAVAFDDYGNFAYGRILRPTSARVMSQVFRNSVTASGVTGDNTLAQFGAQMKSIHNATRFLAVALEETLLALNAEAAALWLKTTDTEDGEEYIYPCLSKGTVKSGFFATKRRCGEGVAADSAFNGSTHLISVMSRQGCLLDGIDGGMGETSKSLLTVPLGNRERGLLGALQMVNKKERPGFDQEDLKLAMSLAEIIGSFLYGDSWECAEPT